MLATGTGDTRALPAALSYPPTNYRPAPEPRMTQVIYMMPKRTHLSWDPRLEPLDLETEPGVEVPLLGYVSASRPVETPEEQETIRSPAT
jgi:hypothetical protein